MSNGWRRVLQAKQAFWPKRRFFRQVTGFAAWETYQRAVRTMRGAHTARVAAAHRRWAAFGNHTIRLTRVSHIHSVVCIVYEDRCVITTTRASEVSQRRRCCVRVGGGQGMPGE